MAEESFLEYIPSTFVVPQEELASRHTRIRDLMAKRDLDLLLVAADMNIHKRGHVRYVSGYCTIDYYSYVLFPREGELAFFGHYRGYARWARVLTGITKSGFTPFGEEQEVGGHHVLKMIEDYKTTAPLITRIFADPKVDSAFDKTDRRLRLHLRGTNFQIKVWEALLNIPTGTVTTYEHIAAQIGNPKAIRAVGTAVGHNPIAVLIPCHRVIRKSGEFGNYRYGVARKKALLAKEFVARY